LILNIFESFAYRLNPERDLQPLIQLALAEDAALNDITSLATIAEGKKGSAKLIAKQEGVLAGLFLVPMILAYFPEQAKAEFFLEDTALVAKGETILRISGSLRAILSAERIILNFLQHLSGIATYTHKINLALQSAGKIQLLDTRKTLPGYRYLEKYAVRCGGAWNHRPNLGEMFLIKENHISAAGSLEKAVRACKDWRARAEREIYIELEVRTLAELKEALGLGVDLIMLDHFNREMVYEAASLNQQNIPLEISGNLDLEKISSIKDWPIQYISMGALTHSAPALDLSLLVEDSE
jgi:nicotinate-nucleotide pyrophosphorylase (carboxylating)